VAKSNYRQVRVTFTQEVSGQLSVSLYGKGLNDAWSEHTCLDRWRPSWDEPIVTQDDVIRALVHALCERQIPGIG
jgi:hypothetical protein